MRRVELGQVLSLQQAKDLVGANPAGRFASDWTLDRTGAVQAEAKALVALSGGDGRQCWMAWDGSQLVGMCVALCLTWDTDFWGFRCGSIEAIHVVGTDEEQHMTASQLLGEVERWAVEHRLRFLSARAPVDHLPAIHALERKGFGYVETTLTNTFDIRDGVDPASGSFQLPPGHVIRAPRMGEHAELMAMTTDAFVTHRFYADPHFSRAQVDEMYRRWVANSLESKTWTTIVLEAEGRPMGLFIYRIEDHYDDVGLRLAKWRMGVLGAAARGAGYGVMLFRGAMQHVHGVVDVVDSGLSLRNTRSFNIHSRLGFRALCFSATYHRWF